ncbi:14117_t:CDS:1, partial [Entrophospora sp. SA101]
DGDGVEGDGTGVGGEEVVKDAGADGDATGEVDADTGDVADIDADDEEDEDS